MDDAEMHALVKEARRSEKSFTELWGILRPRLVPAARRLVPRAVDDALQMACLAIWNSLEKIDDRGPAQYYLLRSGFNGINRFARAEIQHTKNHEGHTMAFGVWKQQEEPPPIVEWTGMLRRYYEYAEKNGTLVGAGASIARELGVSTGHVTRLFHQQSRDFIEEFEQ